MQWGWREVRMICKISNREKQIILIKSFLLTLSVFGFDYRAEPHWVLVCSVDIISICGWKEEPKGRDWRQKSQHWLQRRGEVTVLVVRTVRDRLQGRRGGGADWRCKQYNFQVCFACHKYYNCVQTLHTATWHSTHSSVRAQQTDDIFFPLKYFLFSTLYLED